MLDSAMVQVLKILEKEDCIEKFDDRFSRLFDLLLKSAFIEYGSDYFLYQKMSPKIFSSSTCLIFLFIM